MRAYYQLCVRDDLYKLIFSKVDILVSIMITCSLAFLFCDASHPTPARDTSEVLDFGPASFFLFMEWLHLCVV